jgi:hypothetical protein
VTFDRNRTYLVEADQPVVRDTRIGVIRHLVDPVTAAGPGGQDFGGNEHMPGRQLFRVREAAMQHGVGLTRGRRHFPEKYVDLGVGLIALGTARLAHLLHGSRL